MVGLDSVNRQISLVDMIFKFKRIQNFKIPIETILP